MSKAEARSSISHYNSPVNREEQFLNTSPHCAEHLEKPEVSKNFRFNAVRSDPTGESC